MGKRTPQPPAPPDPRVVAQAQTGSNLASAIGSAYLGNANQVTPWGTTTFTPTSFNTVTENTPDGRGGSIGNSYQVPQFTQTTTLSPQQQILFDQQNQIDQSLNATALNQANRIGGILSTPYTGAGLPDTGNLSPGNRPNYINTPTDRPDLVTSLGDTNYEQARRDVENAIYSRMEPQLLRQREGLENRLVNQGLTPGTEAYNRAIDVETRAANDARQQAVLAGGQEQSRLFNIALQDANFRNQALQQGFTNEEDVRRYYNQMASQAFGDQLNLAGRMDTQRERALQEQLAIRNQPINEVVSLLNGQPLNLPQFTQYRPTQMQAAPIGDYTYNSAALANQQYQQQLAQQNAMMGGLFGLGSSAILGATMGRNPLFSDRRLKEAIRDTGLSLLNGIKVYLYRYIGDPTERVGYIAQEVETVVPAAVSWASGFRVVDYEQATR